MGRSCREVEAMIFFAKIFDNLLAMGLDLNYSMAKNPPVKNSTNEPLPQALKDDNRMFRLCTSFLEAKKTYELYVIEDYYETNKNTEFIKDVNNAIDFGGYTHPETLKKILLNNKYKHLTLEKLYKEWSDHVDK